MSPGAEGSPSVGRIFYLLDDATDGAGRIVTRGKEQWNTERINRLAGEAVVMRVGELAHKLPDYIRHETPEVRWKELRGLRNEAAHEIGVLDSELLWATLRHEVPGISRALGRWQGRNLGPAERRIIARSARGEPFGICC